MSEKLKSEKGYADSGVVVLFCAVLIMSMAIFAHDSNTQQALNWHLDVANAKIALLEQGFTNPRKQKGENKYTVGFGPACHITLNWNGKNKTFSFKRFNAPWLNYPTATRNIPVIKNASYDKIRNLREMKVCGAKPHHNY